MNSVIPGSLPVIDVGPLRRQGDAGRQEAIASLGHTLEHVGFAYLSGHGIPDALVTALHDAAGRFHDLPEAAKLAIRVNAFHRGFIPGRSGSLTASATAVTCSYELSDALMLMHELPPGDPVLLRGDPLQGANQWPDAVPELRPVALRYMAEMTALGRDLARALAEMLGLLPSFFLPHFDRPTQFLRLLQSPPKGEPGSTRHGVALAPQMDYGFISLLAQDEHGGLEVRAKGGGWIPAPPVPGTFVMSIGDILHRWSNGRLAPTPYRVINRNTHRLASQTFFFDPSMDSVIECPSSLLRPGETPRAVPVRWGDCLMARLDSNYDYRQGPSPNAAPVPGTGNATPE